jgi:hypothetical protein
MISRVIVGSICLFVCLFIVFRLRIFHLYGDVTTAGLFICLFVFSRLSNFSAIRRLSPLPVTGLHLDPCLALMAFSNEGSFSCQHLLRHGTTVYTVSSERPAFTSQSGIRTGDAKITSLLRLRSNHCSTRAVKGYQIKSFARRSGPLSRENLYCVTGPQYFPSHPKDRPIQSPLTTHTGMWRTHSNLDPHGLAAYVNFGILLDDI